MKLSAWRGVALVALIALGAARVGGGGDASDYKFSAAPVNSMGVAGIADLRGVPILIDFWGTR